MRLTSRPPAASCRGYSDKPMDITILGQARQAVLSLLFGLCAGFLYDFFRALRRKFPSELFTALTDALFWIICAFSLFLFGMTVGGGQQRIFVFVFSALGFCVYLYALSSAGFWVWNTIVVLISRILSYLLIPLAFFCTTIKKIALFAKKVFHKSIKRRIMNNTYLKLRKHKVAGFNAKKKGVNESETQTRRYFYENSDHRASGVRGLHSRRSLFSGERRKR